MRKFIVPALVASFILSVHCVAMASPVFNFNGDVRLEARGQDNKNAAGDQLEKRSFWQYRTRVNFEGIADEQTTFFGRFSVRNEMGGKSNASNGNFDQYGVKLTADDWTFKIGRQAVFLGQGTIINTGTDAVNWDNKFDGLVASSKLGNVDANFIGGKTNDDLGIGYSIEWYGFDAASRISDHFTLGTSYAHYKPASNSGVPGTDLYGVNFVYNPTSQLSLNGEYVKSDLDTNNKAYFVSGTYSSDKDIFSVQYQKVERNAVDPNNSGIGANCYPFGNSSLYEDTTGYKGMTYYYKHNMTKIASYHLIYMDLKGTSSDAKTQEWVAGVTWKFQ